MDLDPCSSPNCCAGSSRRAFLKSVAVGIGSMPFIAGPFTAAEAGPSSSAAAFIPADKKLNPAWIRSLFEKGARKVYRAKELATIGMPIGGIAAGQVYLTGDGRLAHFDIFNHTRDTGPGDKCYVWRTPDFPLEQGFTIAAGKATRSLDQTGFAGVTFVGEYPIGTVTYADPSFPLVTTLEAFSPFAPLNAADSALPATVLSFTIENTSNEPQDVTLTGRLENAVLLHSKDAHEGTRVNQTRTAPGVTFLECSVVPPAPAQTRPAAPPETFADFEGTDYGDWKVEGAAFGTGPARGTLPGQQRVSGFRGHGLVNSFAGGDASVGKLTSPTFTIRRPYLTFLIGGGAAAGKTCMNLVVDGRVVRTATGRNNERLEPASWNVRDLVGKTAHIEIVDDATGGWGHINVDQIEFSDAPPATHPLTEEPDFGTMGLALFMPPGAAQAPAMPDAQPPATAALGEKLVGTLSHRFTLAPRAKQTVTFAITWHFPNRPGSGHFYAARFDSAFAVARYLADNLDRLTRETRLWHDTYYDSTLPHWLLDRLHMPVSTLATATTQWWKNGRFWCWEGVGCCSGTCTHVYNYAQAAAHLFPELERSAREMQDLGAGFHPESGLVGFRGGAEYAADGQAGTILKAYREHLFCADGTFLKRNYERIKQALQFLINHDASPPVGPGWRPGFGTNAMPHPTEKPDGIIEDAQHNTYDIWFHGPNTFVGSLYLAALRAGEEMARLNGDSAFAATCRKLFDAGSKFTDEELFDGDYYFQKVDLKAHPEHQYDHGCLSDQLFGQNWAGQLGLGYLYKPDRIRTALASIYRYNWTPDVGPYSEAHPPGRWFARPGEAGLITCTFPKSPYLSRGVLYREEVWTGIEYQVASHMIQEGMLDEALVLIRGVHDRYDATKHNPWNEIECGDHYGRAMASWGCLTALSGFHYDGPAGALSFNPRLTPDDFRCAFTTAAGWGTYRQSKQQAGLTLKWGRLALRALTVPIAAQRATLNGKPLAIQPVPAENGTTLSFEDLALAAGDELVVS
jgi:non-lysosomal glucosylceramidase